MKHFTLLTGKRHILLVLIMLLCSVRVAYADDSGLVTQQITVNVPTAGTLSNIIQSDKMFKITNLKITGSLNADDIRFIRKMAGCYYNGNGSKYDGHLQYLDLGSLSQISYVHSFEVYDENGYRSTLNDCLFPLAYLYNLKTVVLPDFYKDYNFSLMGCRNLTTAKMPDNLEKIGNNTFKDCSSLVDISLSPTITSIGEYAFSGCSSLTEIQIPNNVTYIGKYAFHGCSSLKGINVPTGLVNISASTFENCANLEYFFNYNYIESIGDRAFAGCSKLTRIVNLFVGSPSIGTYVFENCKSLKSVWVPENMKTLPRGMFKGCSSLSSVTLPQYLLSIDDYAFDGCTSLTDIKLPIYLNTLGYRALADCSKLTSLDLPSSLQSIGSYAFAGCNAMERIDAYMAAPITASQSTFNGIDFSNCYLYVPTGAYQSYWLANGWGSFEHIIDNLDPQKSKMVTLETAGTLRDKIGYNEKFSITHLKVSGPINTNDIQCIREMAGCYIDPNGSKYNGSLHHLDLRDASYSGDGPMIDVYDQNGYKGYMYIYTQKNAVHPVYLFSYLDGLQTVILPNNEEEIGEHMFTGCSNLKNIEIPASVQAIGSYAFKNCSSLEALNLPYGITCIEYAVFANCFNLKDIEIPESVTTINNTAFVNCRSLTSITIPDNVTSIGEYAFNGCSNLKSLYLPANIKNIGDVAFNCCGRLTRIIAKMKEPVAIGEDTFAGLDYDKCELLVPEGSAEAYRQAAVWSNFNNITDITVVVTDYAGLLQYMIEKNDKNYKNKITRLKVIGPIGISDIQYIREMAGCWLEESGKKTDGNLQYLDLQEAKLVGSNVSINVYTNGSNQGETNPIECTAKIEPDGNDFSNLFRKVSKLNTVIMPSYLTTTGRGTFMDSPLSSITLPKNLTYIDDNAFNGCGGLRDISIPSGVTSIGNGAFEGCWLQHIYLHDGLKSIGNYAFANSALKEINIPNSVEYIGEGCFASCGLEEAVISSDYIAEIPNEAFADCNALHTIKLPANLERIGERAFIGTWRLGTKEGLTIPSKVREIGAEAFYKSLFDAVDIVLPASLTNIYSAFSGSGARVIHCYMPEPLPLNDFSFGGGGGSLSNCKLYVPKGCANKYRNAEVWRDFDIEEMEVTGIGSVTNDSTVTEVARYDANGQQLSVPTKGLNIVHYSDGTMKKIMVE